MCVYVFFWGCFDPRKAKAEAAAAAEKAAENAKPAAPAAGETVTAGNGATNAEKGAAIADETWQDMRQASLEEARWSGDVWRL